MENTGFDSIRIGLASPEQIREWSHGVVEKPETINYRTQKPEKDGLFCEKIFGPTKDWECHCGKYKKVRFKGKKCERCGVEVTRAKVRRERMGSIELAAPVSHIWYFKGTPSRIGQILEMTQKKLDEVLYFTKYIVTWVDDSITDPALAKNSILSDEEYKNMCEKYGENLFEAEMGAEAILKLLKEYDPARYDALKNRMVAIGKLELTEDQRKDCRNCESNYNCNECPYCKDLDISWKNNLELLSDDLKAEAGDSSGQKKIKILKRLQLVEDFRISNNKPEWMILTVIPVIPPDLRPMVPLDGGRYATSDMNELYRRVINRNERLRKLIEDDSPTIIIRNEKRMLQEAVDALIDNGRRGRAVTGSNGRPLKSLSDMLKGKQGRFRQNLLGKRVDYSGRSVIVVGPELKMYQCGVPKEMALELFKPFVLKRLQDNNKNGTSNIKNAKKKVERQEPEVWDALEQVIKSHPVLLNRAPTLHRLGIQAFEPVLVEGRALKLHPLVCTAYNADFDGDQMAIHLPLSAEAQAEARFLMLAANNLLKPSDGKPVAVPSQDMVLGSYYLTLCKDEKYKVDENGDFILDEEGRRIQVEKNTEEYKNDIGCKYGEKGAGKIFRNVDEVMMAYYEGDVSIHAPIKVRITKERNDKKISGIINCTVGKLIFNENIPQNLGYVDRRVSEKEFDLEIDFLVGKKQLGDIIDRCIRKNGTADTSEVLDKIKSTGYKYSTRAALTVATADVIIPSVKQSMLDQAQAKENEIIQEYNFGMISDEERYKQICETWKECTDNVTDALQKNFKGEYKYNPIWLMADSGARGSIQQLRQLAGMRGLIADTSGKTIEVPIRSNYREGLNILDYFSSSRGARKGLADTALRTADSGYLTRRLVDVSQDVIIREHDCGTTDGIEVYDIINGQKTDEELRERLVGRFLIEDLRDENNDLIHSKNNMITPEDAEKICKAGFTRVKVRSVVGCKAKQGVCAKCYGMNLANNNLVTIGEAVGTIAAQSIGEPGTQLTMRTFHTGGIADAEGNVTQGLPRVEELFEARRPKNICIISEIDGEVKIAEQIGKMKVVNVIGDEGTKQYEIPYNYKLIVENGQRIEKGAKLTFGDIYPKDLLNILGKEAAQDYIIAEVQHAYRSQGVAINDRHIEVIIRQMMQRVEVVDSGSSYLLPTTKISRRELAEVNESIRARMENGETDNNGNKLEFVTIKDEIQGITKAASHSDSFLSNASFQETTRALTDAAIRGKIDHLLGLKENVLVGKLIPAGTGLPDYNNVEIESTEIASEHIED